MRRWRKKHGKTLEDVAEATGASQPMLSYIERFERQPSLGLAVKLSDLSGIPVNQFVRQENAA